MRCSTHGRVTAPDFQQTEFTRFSSSALVRRRMEDAVFRRERLHTAVARLQDRLKEARALEEEDQRRWIAHEKAKAERDRLAADLKAIYPQIEVRQRELLTKIDERQLDRDGS